MSDVVPVWSAVTSELRVPSTSTEDPEKIWLPGRFTLTLRLSPMETEFTPELPRKVRRYLQSQRTDSFPNMRYSRARPRPAECPVPVERLPAGSPPTRFHSPLELPEKQPGAERTPRNSRLSPLSATSTVR